MNLIPDDLENRFAAAYEAKQAVVNRGVPEPRSLEVRAAYFRDLAVAEAALVDLYREARLLVPSLGLLWRALVVAEIASENRAESAAETAEARERDIARRAAKDAES